MGRRFYRTGQFARKVAVSVRTLRYYDKVGLLRSSPYRSDEVMSTSIMRRPDVGEKGSA